MVMVRASGIRGYVATMRGLGVDPLPLLRRHRISLASLDDDDALLSLRSVVHLLEASAAEADCPDLGLRISQHQDIGILGPLGVVMQNAATAKEAVLYASRLLFLQSPGLKLVFNDKSPLIEGAVLSAATAVWRTVTPVPLAVRSIATLRGESGAAPVAAVTAAEHVARRPDQQARRVRSRARTTARCAVAAVCTGLPHALRRPMDLRRAARYSRPSCRGSTCTAPTSAVAASRSTTRGVRTVHAR